MKQRRAESRDCALKEEQLLNTSTAPKSSWQATGELEPLLESSPEPGYSSLVGKIGGTIASHPKQLSVPFQNVWNCRFRKNPIKF